MKTKGKKIVTPATEEKKNETALTTNKANVWDALDKITRELPPGRTSEVQSHVQGIQSDIKVMYEKRDSIASHLAAIHVLVGKDGFATFADNVMPRFGISKSTVYRWLESGQLLKGAVPDLQLRQTLLGRTEKPLTTNDQKTGAVILTPAFAKALEQNPMPKPKDDGKGNMVLTPEDVDNWTSTVAAATRKLGKGKAKSKGQLKKVKHDRLVELFQSFMETYGVQDAENLVGELDGLVTQETRTIEAPKAAKKVAAVN